MHIPTHSVHVSQHIMPIFLFSTGNFRAILQMFRGRISVGGCRREGHKAVVSCRFRLPRAAFRPAGRAA